MVVFGERLKRVRHSQHYENSPVNIKVGHNPAKTLLKIIKTGYFGCEAEFAEV